MSIEQAKAFIERMKTDSTFRERVMGSENFAARMSLVNSEGFKCTAEEIKQLDSELRLKSEDKRGVYYTGGNCPKLNSC